MTTVKRVDSALRSKGLRGYVGKIERNQGEVVLWIGGSGYPVESVAEAIRVVHAYGGGGSADVTPENPVLPRYKWVNAQIRVTKNGKIQARIARTTTRRRRR